MNAFFPLITFVSDPMTHLPFTALDLISPFFLIGGKCLLTLTNAILSGVKLENVQCVKDLDVMIDLNKKKKSLNTAKTLLVELL